MDDDELDEDMYIEILEAHGLDAEVLAMEDALSAGLDTMPTQDEGLVQ